MNGVQRTPHTHLENTVPLLGEFGPPSDGLRPHQREVCDAAKVLSDGDAVVQVQNYMPPATRNKDRLSRTLQNFNLEEEEEEEEKEEKEEEEEEEEKEEKEEEKEEKEEEEEEEEEEMISGFNLKNN